MEVAMSDAGRAPAEKNRAAARRSSGKLLLASAHAASIEIESDTTRPDRGSCCPSGKPKTGIYCLRSMPKSSLGLSSHKGLCIRTDSAANFSPSTSWCSDAIRLAQKVVFAHLSLTRVDMMCASCYTWCR